MRLIRRSLVKCMALLICPICCQASESAPQGWLTEHFMEEVTWVADELRLDVGGDSGPLRGWSLRGTRSQKENKKTVVAIVNYCATAASAQIGDIPESLRNFPSQAAAARQSYEQASLVAWRLCEGNETAAYRRLISGNEFKDVDPRIIKTCSAIPGSDSYVTIELCIQSEARAKR